MDSFLKNIKKSTDIVASLEPSIKNAVLYKMANALRENSALIITENKKDIGVAKQNSLKLRSSWEALFGWPRGRRDGKSYWWYSYT